MSRRIPRWAPLMLVAAFGLPPGEVAAQQTNQVIPRRTEAELVRHIDSLLPLFREAELAAAEAKVRREEAKRLAAAPATDTFMVGPVRIVSLPGQRTLAEEVYRKVWDAEYGPFVESSPAMEGQIFTFMWRQTVESIYIDGHVTRVEMQAWRPRESVEEAVRQGVSNVLAFDLAEPATRIPEWFRGTVRRPTDAREIYRDLALSASQAARACLDGDADQCWSALGLHPEDDYPLDEWYSPEERMALVGLRRGWNRPQQQPLWDSCVQDGDTSSCDTFLADQMIRYGGTFNMTPLNPDTRGSMLWIALQVGGEGAWDRLREDPNASPAEALLHASGLSRDETVDAWLTYVRANRPASKAGTGQSFLLALLWIAAFGTLAMRSTRWRLG